MLKKIVALVGLLTLAGCPYTEGCEALPASGAPDGGADAATDGNDVGDGSVDASVSDGRPPFVPVGPASPRCEGLDVRCGSVNDCCASALVPGGTFNRSNDATYPATVSDFKLDVYEITVGRFRAFVNSGNGTQAKAPAEGAGAHANIPGSGWSSTWNANLAPDTNGLSDALKCNVDYTYWSEAPAANETRPMNCITWYDAMAFCIWDGGYLPTEAEWNYAAAGGAEQRSYAWGEGLDDAKASFGCTSTGEAQVRPCTYEDFRPVGSKSPGGDGRWGHADLTGNAWEWTLDWSTVPYRLTPCTDCAELEPSLTPASGRPANEKTFRGGAFNWGPAYQITAFRASDPPTVRFGSVGARCARPAN